MGQFKGIFRLPPPAVAWKDISARMPQGARCSCCDKLNPSCLCEEYLVKTMKTPKQRRPNREQMHEYQDTCINDLPLAIITNIISFLPSIDAIRTTVIGPTWHNLWHSIPNLHFDMIAFHLNIPNTSIREARELFAGFISKVLSHRRESDFRLQKFTLRFCYRNNLHVRSYIDSWLEILTKCKVVELDLFFPFHSYHQNPAIPFEEEDDDSEHDPFDFYSPQFLVFSDSAIKVLKLRGVILQIPPEALSLKFDSIREVHLDRFRSSDKDIEHLMTSCVNLESLSLLCGGVFKNLKIESQKLKHFKLFDFHVTNFEESSIEICAPSLVSINLAYVYAEKFSLNETPSLVEAHVIFLQRSWWDLAYWTNIVSRLTGIERLSAQNMWPWSMNGLQGPFTTTEELEDSTPEGENFDVPSFVPKEVYFRLQPKKEVLSGTFKFHKLKHVELLTGFSPDDVHGLESMFQKCPELTSLVLISKYESFLDNYNQWPHLDARMIDLLLHNKQWLSRNGNVFFLPSLKLVEIKNFGATKNQMYVVELLKFFGGELEKITVYPKMANGRSQRPIVLYEYRC